MKQNRSAAELLEISEQANYGFDQLISLIADAMSAASSFSVRQILDGDAFDDLLQKIELCVLGSAGDSRVIDMARSILSFAHVPDTECRIDSEGNIHRRQVYFIQKSDGAIKIGSSINLNQRIGAIQTSAGEEVVLLAHIDGSMGREQKLHAMFREERVYGEWFSPSDRLLEFIEGIRRIQESPQQPSLLTH